MAGHSNSSESGTFDTRQQGRSQAPIIGASYFQATRRFWSGYFSFSGRASRSEFWWQRLTDSIVVVLTLSLVPNITGIPNADAGTTVYQNIPGFLGIGQSIFGLFFGGIGLDGHHHALALAQNGPPTQWVLLIWCLATAIPNIALGFRRLHDRDTPGWIALLGGVPLLDLGLLIIALGPSVRSGSRYDRSKHSASDTTSMENAEDVRLKAAQ